MDRKVMLRRRFTAWRGTMRCLIGKSEFRIFFFFFSSILVPFFLSVDQPIHRECYPPRS